MKNGPLLLTKKVQITHACNKRAQKRTAFGPTKVDASASRIRHDGQL